MDKFQLKTEFLEQVTSVNEKFYCASTMLSQEQMSTHIVNLVIVYNFELTSMKQIVNNFVYCFLLLSVHQKKIFHLRSHHRSTQ